MDLPLVHVISYLASQPGRVRAASRFQEAESATPYFRSRHGNQKSYDVTIGQNQSYSPPTFILRTTKAHYKGMQIHGGEKLLVLCST